VSQNNLHQIGIAMHNYAANHDGRLPPAASRDPEGRPLLSWRVLLLPYIEDGEQYEQFHLDEPWDSPHNLALLPKMPRTYKAPADAFPGNVPYTTFYQAFTGPDTAFELSTGPRLLDDFPKSTSVTILVVEASEAVPWTKPQDIEYDPDKPLPKLGGVFTGPGRFRLLPSSRRKGANVLMADGSARFVDASTPELAWRWAISRTTRQPMPSEW
jgi:prepilin-type processing-associated H-X9-DG protein